MSAVTDQLRVLCNAYPEDVFPDFPEGFVPEYMWGKVGWEDAKVSAELWNSHVVRRYVKIAIRPALEEIERLEREADYRRNEIQHLRAEIDVFLYQMGKEI